MAPTVPKGGGSVTEGSQTEATWDEIEHVNWASDADSDVAEA